MATKELLKNKIEVTVLNEEVKPSPFGRGTHTEYEVELSYNGKNFVIPFHDSVYNYENGIALDENDVIYAVLMDGQAYVCSRDIQDFANEYGYDLYDEFGEDYNPELLRVYTACHEIYNNLYKLFTPEEVEQLQEEFQDY